MIKDKVDKLYYTTLEVCNIVNFNLGLTDGDTVNPVLLSYYLKRGIIPQHIVINKRRKRKGHKYSKDDLKFIIETIHLIKILKVPLDKIDFIKNYIDERVATGKIYVKLND